MPPRLVVAAHKKVSLELLRRVAEKTPVKTGRAKGNNQLTLGTPAQGETGRTDASKRKRGGRSAGEESRGEVGSGTIAAGVAALAGLQAFGLVWLSNNVPYFQALEDGSSKHAPQGMVAISLEEVDAMFP